MVGGVPGALVGGTIGKAIGSGVGYVANEMI